MTQSDLARLMQERMARTPHAPASHARATSAPFSTATGTWSRSVLPTKHAETAGASTHAARPPSTKVRSGARSRCPRRTPICTRAGAVLPSSSRTTGPLPRR
ncbi:hypothetical protein AKJ09_11071 [Labilithrix luteola]|uniref:Uncharacterized protein n=1 Tax=Labilithrix luteola TaxID=1391654 RepID=A0A0K1QFA7_9BACT|nr:hypothetical protein AKJ09_11071 [Labilithrix luteola]